jgi:hypothetical protein
MSGNPQRLSDSPTQQFFRARNEPPSAIARLRYFRINLEMFGNIFPQRNGSRTPYEVRPLRSFFGVTNHSSSSQKKGGRETAKPYRFVSAKQTSAE